MEWILCIVVGIIIGLGIAVLAGNEETAESTRIFTEDDYFEKNFREVERVVKDKWKQIRH